ncbi:hypothetical protein N0V88_005550 [Collariella sp. IMI 366227]|nr:hypothetical protein N0V88_005550 [Collariella sp. IMI 366227]
MADFGDYPPNLPVRDALIIRQTQGPDHAVVPYTGADLARRRLHLLHRPHHHNPTPGSSSALGKRKKNVLTGTAEETFISEHTFRSKHRAVERDGGGVVWEGMKNREVKEDMDLSLTKEVGSITNYIPKKVVHVWRHHSKAVTALQLFPQSSHLGLSGAADGQIKIWDVYREKELLRTFLGHNKAITDLSFNNNGTRFLSGGFDRRIRLWDTETGQCVNRFNCGKTPHVIKFNPSAENGHEFLAGLSDNRILQYDSRAGNETVQEYDHHLGAINTIEFIDESRRFMSTSDDRSLRVWEYGIPVEIKTISEPDMFALTKSAQHPSGKYVLYQCSDNSIVAYSSGSDKFRQHRKKAWRGHNTAGSAIGLTCSPDGQFVASGDTGGSVCFWDFKTCRMYNKLTADGAGGPISCVAWSEQETSKVFTAGAKGEIKLWD